MAAVGSGPGSSPAGGDKDEGGKKPKRKNRDKGKDHESSAAVNAINSEAPICFAARDKGVRDRPDCRYNHDPAKLKEARKEKAALAAGAAAEAAPKGKAEADAKPAPKPKGAPQKGKKRLCLRFLRGECNKSAADCIFSHAAKELNATINAVNYAVGQGYVGTSSASSAPPGLAAPPAAALNGGAAEFTPAAASGRLRAAAASSTSYASLDPAPRRGRLLGRIFRPPQYQPGVFTPVDRGRDSLSGRPAGGGMGAGGGTPAGVPLPHSRARGRGGGGGAARWWLRVLFGL